MKDVAGELPGQGGSFALSLLALGVVCLFAYGALRLIARRHGRSEGAIRVMARCQLEPRRSVLVIRVGSRDFLLAASEAGIGLIAELEAADVYPSGSSETGISTERPSNEPERQ